MRGAIAMPVPEPPAKTARLASGRWFCADQDADSFEQEFGDLQIGEAFEFGLRDSSGAPRGMGAGLLCAKYAAAAAGGTVEIVFLAAQSPALHDFLSYVASTSRGRLCLHLCKHCRCPYSVEGWLIPHAECWRARQVSPGQPEWFWTVPAETDPPGGGAGGRSSGPD